MGRDTLTLLGRNEVKDCPKINCGGKVKWVCLSATILLLLIIFVTFSLALIKLGASTTCEDAIDFEIGSHFYLFILY